MKKAVILVAVALLLAVVLIAGVIFIPALMNPVIEYDSRVTIDAPKADVWRAFNDDKKTKQWIKGLESIELVSGEKRQPGSRYRLVVNNEGEKVEMIETIEEVKEGELFAFTLDAEPLTDNVRVTFEEKDGKTEMVQYDSVKAKGIIWQTLFYWMQSTFQQSTQEHLERFKNLVEEEQKGR
ncbi:MAG TPA: SRPBCC domain-containing protein [Aridibacter sp.]|nr:SRPBCC domain-containing protein [Aridibacter sp.]